MFKKIKKKLLIAITIAHRLKSMINSNQVILFRMGEIQDFDYMTS